MNRSTRKLQFDTKTKKLIAERDGMCLFCAKNYHMPENPKDYELELRITDIMHVVNKSQGGMGVEENGVLGCRYHHHQMDNGAEGLGKEMREMCEEYLANYYGGWSKEHVMLKKYA